MEPTSWVDLIASHVALSLKPSVLCFLSLQYGRYIRSALRQEKGLSAIADLLTYDSERVVKAASGALRNLAVDSRNKELIGESRKGRDLGGFLVLSQQLGVGNTSGGGVPFRNTC